MRVAISNNPTTGTKREVENMKVIINEGERFVQLACEVINMDNEGNEIMPRQTVNLTATDSHMVDENGDVVEENGIRTEFEHYMHIAENVPAKVNDLRRAAISKADLSGKFNYAIPQQ